MLKARLETLEVEVLVMGGYKLLFIIYYIKSVEFSPSGPMGVCRAGTGRTYYKDTVVRWQSSRPVTHSLSIPPHGWDQGWLGQVCMSLGLCLGSQGPLLMVGAEGK